MNSIRKFVAYTSWLPYLLFFSLLSFIIGDCSNIESEKAYCQKKAEEYFLLCLANIKVTPSYFGKVTWTTPEVQSYAQGFCLAEYARKLKCLGNESYKPHRKD